MTDWIKWKGGDRPPPPDAHTEVRSRSYVNRVGLAGVFEWHTGEIIDYRILNQHLIDAKQAEIDRLREALKVAATAELFDPATGLIDADVLEIVQDVARAALNPTIAREAVLDQLTSEAQEENMGYDKETER